MKYCNLGRAGLKVSRLCLGTANFAGGGSGYGNWGSVPEGEAHRIMDAALDAGINFFDTANVYGNFGEGGHCGMSEEIIGRWFKQGGGRRERTVLGTKLERVMEQDAYDGPNKPRGLSLYKIRRHFAASLKRLQSDHVELLTMHHPDRRTGWEEMGSLRGAGRARTSPTTWGSNFAADMMKAQDAARRRGFMGLVSSSTAG
jgi:aryl-alcohol dehydrogenase-like predicted oxidoreductase